MSITQSTSHQAANKPTLLLKLTIAMIGMFAFLQVYSIQAILPTLIQAFHATEVQAGLAVGMTVTAIAVMSPFMGMLSDAIGRKIFVVGCLFLIAIPTALMGFGESIFHIQALRFLQGLFVPGITVVTIAYISEEFSDHIATMMSMYVSGTVLGGFSGRFIIGYLDSLIGWQNGYKVMAALMILGAIWALKTLPASKNFVISGNFKSSLNILFRHTKNPYVISACLLGACVLFSLVGIFTFINLHLAHAPYYLSSAQLANIFAVYLIGMVITPLSTRLIGKYGTARTLISAVILSMMGVLTVLSTPLWLIIIGLTIMSTGVFIAQTATISYISTHVNEGRSLASGLYYMCYYAGGSIGAWACGIAFKGHNWLGVCIIVGVIQILALTVIYLGMLKKT